MVSCFGCSSRLVVAVDLLGRRILEEYRGTIRDCGHYI